VLEGNDAGRGGASVSLLTSSTGNPRDSVGYYALSNDQGGFSIAGDYRCAQGKPVYLYARGGGSGKNTPNAAIGLMAFLGVCPEAGNFDTKVPFVFMNAATTVAAAYALGDDATDPTHYFYSGPAPWRVTSNIAASLVHTATGMAGETSPPTSGSRTSRRTINTLANILSACINSSAPDSHACAILFANARETASSAAPPRDTAAAAINIVQRPRANVGTLYALQSSSDRSFQPALAAVPDDFSVVVDAASGDRSVAKPRS